MCEQSSFPILSSRIVAQEPRGTPRRLHLQHGEKVRYFTLYNFLTNTLTTAAGDHPILLPDPHRSASSLPNFTEPPNTPPPVRRVQTMKSSSSATNVIRGIRRTVSFQMQPERPLGPPPTLLRGLANILMASCTSTLLTERLRVYIANSGLNILLVFLPISVCGFPPFTSVRILTHVSSGVYDSLWTCHL